MKICYVPGKREFPGKKPLIPGFSVFPEIQTVWEIINPIDISISGLVANDRDWFELNGKKMRIFSGSLHYFRVHPEYWRDRLRKYRAAGLNTIDV